MVCDIKNINVWGGGRFLEHVAVFLVRILFRVTLVLVWGDPRSVVLAIGRVAQPTTGVKMRATSISFAWSTSQSPERETRRYHQRLATSMRVFVAYFSQMGSAGCEEDPKFLLATLQHHISLWDSATTVETQCYQAPGKWMPYLTESDDETHIGTDVYSALGGTAFDPWHELQRKYDDGGWVFFFVGASNGCIPAAFFANQFADKTLSLTFLSCVPGAEQWGDVARLHCPITVTCGSAEQFFGGTASIYSFAKTVHANIFAFWGKHLYEGQDTLRRLASFVADASQPIETASTGPQSPRNKSRSPTAAKKNTKSKSRSPSRRNRSETHRGRSGSKRSKRRTFRPKRRSLGDSRRGPRNKKGVARSDACTNVSMHRRRRASTRRRGVRVSTLVDVTWPNTYGEFRKCRP